MFERRFAGDYDVENNPHPGDDMKTIQMTIDEPLLEEVDHVIRDPGTPRSSFIRSALQPALRQHAISRLERQHAEGYARQTVRKASIGAYIAYLTPERTTSVREAIEFALGCDGIE